MNQSASLIAEAATRLFEEHVGEAAVRRAAAGEWLAPAWQAMAAMGLPLALLSEAQGGFGVDPAEALMVVRLAGFHACPLPIGETMLANRLLAEAGLPLAEGAAAIVPAREDLTLRRDGDGWRLGGAASRVPWSEAVETLLVEVKEGTRRRIVRVSRGQWHVTDKGANVAGHRRDGIACNAFVTDVADCDHDLLLGSAALRTLLIAGALDRVLELTIEHVNGRVQFGRALAKFQAVQHECAEIAGEVAAAGAAADIAADGLGRPGDAARLAIASAKLRAGEAVGRAVALAHQLHGAIGFTAEHRLHLFTTALWSWREEYGGHAFWAGIAGDLALAAGADGFWPLLTEA